MKNIINGNHIKFTFFKKYNEDDKDQHLQHWIMSEIILTTLLILTCQSNVYFFHNDIVS